MAKKKKDSIFSAVRQKVENIKNSQPRETNTGVTQAMIDASIARREEYHKQKESVMPAEVSGGTGRLGALTKRQGQRAITNTDTYYEDEREARERIRERGKASYSSSSGNRRFQGYGGEAADPTGLKRDTKTRLRNKSNQGYGRMKTYTQDDGTEGYYYETKNDNRTGQSEKNLFGNATKTKSYYTGKNNLNLSKTRENILKEMEKVPEYEDALKSRYYTQESPNTMKYDDGRRVEYFELSGSGDKLEIKSVPEERYQQTVLLDKGVNASTYTNKERAKDTAIASAKNVYAGAKGFIQGLSADDNKSQRAVEQANKMKDGKPTGQHSLAYYNKAGQATLAGDDARAANLVEQESKIKAKKEEDVLRYQQAVNEELERAKFGASKPMQAFLDVESTAIQMAPGMAVGALVPGGYLTEMAVQSFGNSYNNARLDGATHQQARLSGMQNAAIETLSEMMFTGGRAMGRLTGVKGFFKPGKAVEDVALPFVKSTRGKDLVNAAKKLGLASSEEAAEELVAGIIEPALDNLIYKGEKMDGDWLQDTLHDAAYNAMIGGVLGGMGGSVDIATSIAAGSNIRNNQGVYDLISQGLSMKDGTKANTIAKRLQMQAEQDPENLGNIDVSDLQRAVAQEQQEVRKEVDKKRQVTGDVIRRRGLQDRAQSAEEEYLNQRTNAQRAEILRREYEANNLPKEGYEMILASVMASEQPLSVQGEAYKRTFEAAREMIADRIMPSYNQEEVGEDQQESIRERALSDAEMEAASVARVVLGEAREADYTNFSMRNPAAREAYEMLTGQTIPKNANDAREFIIDANENNYIVAQESEMSRVAMRDAAEILGENTAAYKAFRDVFTGETENLSTISENDAHAIARGFSDAYTLGLASEGKRTLPARTPAMEFLTEEQLQRAFLAGKKQRAVNLEAKEKRIATTKKAQATRERNEEARLDISSLSKEDAKKLSKADRVLFKKVARRYGVNIVVEPESKFGVKTKDGGKALSNGFYDGSVIHLNVDAARPLIAVFSHEFTHHLEDFAPREYQVLKDFVVQKVMDGNAREWNTLVDDVMRTYGKNVADREAAEREVIANMAQEIFAEEDVIREFFGVDQSVAERVMNIIVKIIDDFKKLFRGNESEWAKEIGLWEDYKRLWLDAAKAARKNAGAGVGEQNVRQLIEKDVPSDKGVVYDSIVRLETDIFEGLSDEKRVRALNEWIDQHAGMQLVFYDEGIEVQARLGKKGEKFRKKGAKNKSRVLNKMKGTGDHIKQEAIVNIADLVRISKKMDPSDDVHENNHGWFDDGGWDHRITYFLTPKNEIYRAVLNVANSTDGKILYTITKIKEAGRALARNTGPAQTPTSEDIVTEATPNDNTNAQKKQRRDQLQTKEQVRADLANRFDNYKNDETNLSIAAEAVADLQNVRPKNTSGIKTIARGISEQFIHKGYVDFRGQKIQNAQDLASLGQILRDARYETFRMFFMKGDKIVAVDNVTSRLPAKTRVHTFDVESEWVDYLNKKMARMGADGYYLMHNHPSGDVSHSSEDESMTRALSANVRGFRGHIILDHDKFGYLDSQVNFSEETLDGQTTIDFMHMPSIGHPLLGESLDSAAAVANVGKQLHTSKDVTCLVYVTTKLKVSEIQEVSNAVIKNDENFENYLRNELTRSGSRSVFFITQDSDVYAKAEGLIEKRYVEDALRLYGNGAYISARGTGTAPNPAYTAGLTADQIKARTIQYQITEDSQGRQLTEGQKEYFKDSKVVDENGNLKVMYHGTQNEFTVFDFSRVGEHGLGEGYGIYLADSEEISRPYGQRIIESYVNMKRPAYHNQKTIDEEELIKIIRATAEREAQAEIDEYDGDLAEALKDTWISNYTYTYDKSIEDSYRDVADQILSSNDSDMDIIQEIMHGGLSIRSGETASEFYDLLTDVTGIDGYLTEWPNKDTGEVHDIALAFRSSQIKNVTNENPTENPDIRYQLQGYTEKQKANWANSKSIEVYENREQLNRFVDDALALSPGKNALKRMHLGIIPDSVAAEIERKTGVDVRGLNLSITNYEIKKIFETHGDDQKEARRGQRAINKEDVAMLGEIVTEADEIVLDGKPYNGRPVLRFKKEIDGSIVVVTYVSGRNHSLMVQTMYAARKKSLSLPTTEQAVVNTPGASQGTAPISSRSVTQRTRQGKQKTSKEQNRNQLQTDQERTIAELREKVERLQKDRKRTYGREADNVDVKRVARAILEDASSDFSKAQVERGIKEIFSMLKAGDDFAQIYGHAQDLARSIADASHDMVEVEGASELSNLRSYFKDGPQGKMTIKVDPQYKGDFDRYGGWNAFRKKHMGLVTLSLNSGVDADEVVNEIASLFGEHYRPENENSLDTLIQAILDADSREAKHPEEKRYKTDDREGVPEDVDLGVESPLREEEINSIIDRLLDDIGSQIAPMTTFADRKAAEKETAVKKERDKWKRKRESWKKDRKELIEKLKEERRLAVEAERAKGKEKVRKTEELYRLRIENSRRRNAERSSKRESIRSIEKSAGRLSQALLTPTDVKHVPESYRKVVAQLLTYLDFENVHTDAWTKKYGRPSKRIQAFRDMKDAYEKIIKQDTGFINEDEQFEQWLEYLSDIEGERLSDLDAEQLRTVKMVVQVLEHQVNNANKLLTEGLREGRAEMAEKVHKELKKQKTAKGKDASIQRFIKGDATPVHFFDRLGLDTFKQLWVKLTEAQDRHIRNLDEAMKVTEGISKTYGKKNIKAWSEKAKKYELSNGNTIELTDAQLMSLYALNKREQARGHILGAGVVVAPLKVKRTIKGKLKDGEKERLEQTFTRLSYGDVTRLLKNLSEKQIQAAEEMLSYLKTTSQWGNETSMKLYGYRKFTEDNYFPIQSAREFLNNSSLEDTQAGKIKNIGFTKSVVTGANNPVVLDDFFDVTTSHINQMSQYNTFVPILEDIDRVYHHIEKDEMGLATWSVKGDIRDKHGIAAANYIEQLMRDVNGNVQQEVSDLQAMDNLVRNWKAAKIGLSFRVLFQQPTAVIRAMQYIDPKYFVGTPGGKAALSAVIPETVFGKEVMPKSVKQARDRMYDIVPLAKWKHWGYSQTDIHRSMRDTMMGNEGILDKVFFDMYGKADDFGWSSIFMAVERETRKEHPELVYDSPEYREHVNKRFREIADRTQVVDSVLHRSEIMREKNILARTMTAFMAEPTTTINTLASGISQAREQWRDGNKKPAAKLMTRTGAVFFMNAVAVSLAASLSSTLRESWTGDDDDEKKEKNWIENRLLEAGIEEGSLLYDWLGTYFMQDFRGNINPLSLVPITKDMMSMLEGYDAPNPLFALPSTLLKNMQNLQKWMADPEGQRYTGKYYIERNLEALAELFGVPASNIRKEVDAFTNIYFRAIGEKEYGDYLEDRWMLNDDYSGNKNIFIDHYINAMLRGNVESAEEIRKALIDGGISEEDIMNRSWKTAAPDYKQHVTEGTDYSEDERNLKAVGISEEEITEKRNRYLSSAFEDAIESGNTTRIESIKKKLGESGWGEYDINKKIKSSSMGLIYDALDVEDYSAADRYINVLTENTEYSQADVQDALTTHYMSDYYDAIDTGDEESRLEVRRLLNRYGVSDSAIQEKEAGHYKDYYRQKAYMAWSRGDTDEAYRWATEFNNRYPGVYKKGASGMIYGLQNLTDDTKRKYETSSKYDGWSGIQY